MIFDRMIQANLKHYQKHPNMPSPIAISYGAVVGLCAGVLTAKLLQLDHKRTAEKGFFYAGR